jgi:tRNA(Ile)-lysidine synthase
MRAWDSKVLPMDTSLLKAGMRLAVGVSGGADSVALLRALDARRGELGLVLCVAHLHHGLRGAEADADRAFVQALAAELALVFHEGRVDVGAEASVARESIEEAARRLRYGWFRQLMAAGTVDVVATAHTRDDQAETVCAKFLRGAWTEGLSGVHPRVEFAEGRVVRPLLRATRIEVEAYLTALGQGWREDASNRDAAFTRNRIRHELLPVLETWNPQIREHLAQIAVLARDEEAWWDAELARVAPQILLSGRPVRGGGRASGEALAVDGMRLAALAPALQRRLLRLAAGRMGVRLDFQTTESLRVLALEGRSGQRQELPQGLRAERTPRELRLTVEAVSAGAAEAIPEYDSEVPGEIVAPAFGIRLRLEISRTPVEGGSWGRAAPRGTLRNWRPGDRVQLRYSSGPRKVKEVLERLRVTGSSRAVWPVLEVAGKIIWMKGVELEPEQGIVVTLV